MSENPKDAPMATKLPRRMSDNGGSKILRSVGASKTLARRSSNVFLLSGDDDERLEKVGLCLSGGGIRSMAFSAGVLREVLSHDLDIDYLSTVSGGGFTGSSYMDWKYREGGQDNREWHERFFGRMPHKAACGLFRFEESTWLGVLDLLYRILGSLWNVFVLTAMVFLALNTWCNDVSDIAFGKLLQAHIRGRTVEDIGSTLHLSVVCKLLSGLAFMFKRYLEGKRPTFLRHLIIVLATFIGVGALHLSVNMIQLEATALSELMCRTNEARKAKIGKHIGVHYHLLQYCIYVILPGVDLLFFSIFSGLGVRRCTVLYSFFLITSIQFGGLQVASFGNNAFILVLFIILPWVFTYHQNFFFHSFKSALMTSFYHESGKLASSDPDMFLEFAQSYSGSSLTPQPSPRPGHGKLLDKTNKSLRFADLKTLKPEWICQFTLGNWKYSAEDPREMDGKMMTVTPKMVDIIDHLPADMSKYFDLTPATLELGTGMTMSAASISMFMGVVADGISYIREVFISCGIRTDMYMPCWFRDQKSSTYYSMGKKVIFTILFQLVLGHILLVKLVYPELLDSPLAGLLSLTVVLIALVFATLPVPTSGDDNSSVHNIARYLLDFSPIARHFREFFGAPVVGKYPDYVVHISDGCNLENLGLLPLLKRRVDKIIISDASLHWSTDYADVLRIALNHARMWLGCRFTTMDGDDLDEDLFIRMGYAMDGYAPHTYRFKVIYTEDVFGEPVSVGEGDIIIVQPRHPGKYSDGYWSGEKGSDWTPEVADNLTGCCTSSMSGKYPSFFRSIHGTFPDFFGLWTVAFQTPAQFQALMAEGKRAMSSDAIRDFIGEIKDARQADTQGESTRQGLQPCVENENEEDSDEDEIDHLLAKRLSAAARASYHADHD